MEIELWAPFKYKDNDRIYNELIRKEVLSHNISLYNISNKSGLDESTLRRALGMRRNNQGKY